MRRPIQSVIDTGNGSPRRQALIVGSVIALHAFLGYAIVTGLAQRIVLEAPNILTAEVLPQKDVPPPPAEPLPLKPDMLVTPSAPAVPAPVIRVAPTRPAHSITVVQGPPRPVPPAHQAVVTPPGPAAEPAAMIAPTAARSVMGTHTIPPYPDLARRLGESGAVRLQITLDDAGAIRAVVVARSSGSERLDQAAADWVRANWRYEPATRNGQPVASSLLAEVVFDLRNAR